MGMERLIHLLFEDKYCSRQTNDDHDQRGRQPQIEMDLYKDFAKCHRGILLFCFKSSWSSSSDGSQKTDCAREDVPPGADVVNCGPDVNCDCSCIPPFQV